MTHPKVYRPAVPFRAARVLLLIQVLLFTLAWVVPAGALVVLPMVSGGTLESEDGIGWFVVPILLGAVPLLLSMTGFLVAAGGWRRPRFFAVGAITYESGVLAVLAWAATSGTGVWVGGWPTADDPFRTLGAYGLFAVAVLGAVLAGTPRLARTDV